MFNVLCLVCFIKSLRLQTDDGCFEMEISHNISASSVQYDFTYCLLYVKKKKNDTNTHALQVILSHFIQYIYRSTFALIYEK